MQKALLRQLKRSIGVADEAALADCRRSLQQAGSRDPGIAGAG